MRPVVDGGGMVATRRRGDEKLLRRIGVSVGILFSVLVAMMDGSLVDRFNVGRQ